MQKDRQINKISTCHPTAFALAILLAVPTLAPAQAPLQNALFTAGTAAKDNANDDWAFLLFQLTADIETLFTRRFVIEELFGELVPSPEPSHFSPATGSFNGLHPQSKFLPMTLPGVAETLGPSDE